MEDLLREIGINLEGQTTDDNEYVITIPDSNSYSKVFSKLENSDVVHLAEEDSDFGLDKSSIIFSSDDYVITLDADFDEDKYSLSVTERVED